MRLPSLPRHKAHSRYNFWMLTLMTVPAVIIVAVAIVALRGGEPAEQPQKPLISEELTDSRGELGEDEKEAPPITPESSEPVTRGAAPATMEEQLDEITYDQLLQMVSSPRLVREIESVRADTDLGEATVAFYDYAPAEVTFPPADTKFLNQLAQKGVRVDVDLVARGESAGGGGIGKWLGLFLLLSVIGAIIVFVVASARQRKYAPPTGSPVSGGGMEGLRSDAQVSDELRPRAKFSDVAGCDEAVEEVSEFLDFLLKPEKFTQLGAKMPAGVLLHGPPGTGKTLLARALAGEANASFFAVSGTDFVERFVGVGSSRMRELFQKARASISEKETEEDSESESSPGAAVIFFDEIDAIGRVRGGAGAQTNDERENTLNELLVQLDGFQSRERLIVIAATNRMDILDPALLRPGRFSRQVQVNLPDYEGRKKILQLYAREKPIASDVDLAHWAEITAGCSGAELAEMLNEAAIMAARSNRSEITSKDIGEGHLRVLAGPERRSSPASDDEREIIAYHEAGHVLCAELSDTHQKAQRATIKPRGPGLGLAVYGLSDRALHSLKSLREQLICALGGRAAEEIIFSQVSSGAADDLRKANGMARQAVEELGFSDEVGQISHGQSASEETRGAVDREIVRIVSECYTEALDRLRQNRDKLEALAQALLQFEDLSRDQIKQTIAGAGAEGVAATAAASG